MILQTSEKNNRSIPKVLLTTPELEFFSVLLLIFSFVFSFLYQNICILFLQYMWIMIPLIKIYTGTTTGSSEETVIKGRNWIPYLFMVVVIIASGLMASQLQLTAKKYMVYGVYTLTIILNFYGLYNLFSVLKIIDMKNVFLSYFDVVLYDYLFF